MCSYENFAAKRLAELLGKPQFDVSDVENPLTCDDVILNADQREAVLLALKKPGEEIFMKIKDRLWIWFICLVIFGSGKFILPSMASIVLCFLGMKKHEEKRKKERIQKSGEYQA